MNRKVLFLFVFFAPLILSAQSVDDVLKILTEKKVITQEIADSMRAESAINRQNALPQNQLIIDMEYRPRAETRRGYQQLPADSSLPTFFIGQRTRLNINYEYSNQLSSRFSMQDLRIWGDSNPKGMQGSIQVFEAWVEPKLTQNLWIRIGRQKLVYDNERLFSENNWRIGGNAHDAMTLRWEPGKLKIHLFGAFNQTSEMLSGTNYAPTGYTNYKSLLALWVSYNLTDQLTISSMNVMDGNQAKEYAEKIHQRFTHGIRILQKTDSYSLSLTGYWQHGKNSKGVDLNAWYINPEGQIKYGQMNLKAGAECMSGTSTKTKTKDNGFSTLYGSGHAFNGYLDLFTKFPNDNANRGLLNPYAYITWQPSKKVEIMTSFHYFSTLEEVYKGTEIMDKSMGIENDWIINWKPNNFTKLELGICYADVTSTMEIVKGAQTGAADKTPWFIYTMLTIKPTLLKFKW